MLAGKLALGLPEVQRHVSRPLPEPMRVVRLVSTQSAKKARHVPEELRGESIRHTEIIKGLGFAFCQPLQEGRHRVRSAHSRFIRQQTRVLGSTRPTAYQHHVDHMHRYTVYEHKGSSSSLPRQSWPDQDTPAPPAPPRRR